MDCGCGETGLLGEPGGECDYYAGGYPFCLKCRDHHRYWPNCPGITPDGADAEGQVRSE